MDFLNQLLAFAVTPAFFLIVFLAFLGLVLTKRNSTRLVWLTFSFICFSASLVVAPICDGCQVPELLFPFQDWRLYGRSITVVLIAMFILLSRKINVENSEDKIPKTLFYLLLVFFVINAKTLIYGNVAFALTSFLLLAFLILFLRSLVRCLRNSSDFYYSVTSVAIAGLIFLGSSVYQGIYNFEALSYLNGQYMGMTNNPQMAALILSLVLPSFLYLYEFNRKKAQSYVWFLAILVNLSFVFVSGSRTGLLLSLASVFVFYRKRIGSFLRISIFAILLIALLAPDLAQIVSQFGLDSTVSISRERFFVSPSDTRTHVWKNLWDIFLQYPLFGAPLEGERIGIGENSWLAVAASLGIIGLVPLILFGVEFVKSLLKLLSLSAKDSSVSLACDLLISGFVVILLGSMAEAFLLGNLTFPIFAFFVYVALSNYLISNSRSENSKNLDF